MPSNRNLADLGASIDSGIAGEFLTVGDSGGFFRNPAWTEIASKPTTLDSALATALVDSAYIQARQTDVGLDSALVTSLVDSAYIQARSSVTGLDSAQAINLIDSAYLAARASGGLDSAGVTGIVDSAYVSARASVNSGFGTYTYFATAGQTDFSGSDVDGNVLAYTADGIIVWYNGVQMLDTDDYTASNGTSVSLTRGADSGSSLVIGKWALGSSSSAPATNLGERAIHFNVAGGSSSNHSNIIEYYEISTTGNSSDFGDLSAVTSNNGIGDRAVSNGSRVVAPHWFSSSTIWELEYVTSSTLGNSVAFGDLNDTAGNKAGFSDGTKGYFHSSNSAAGDIDVITIDTTGNAAASGYNISIALQAAGAHANTSRGLFGGGDVSNGPINDIHYVSFPLAANSSDFGDLSETRTTASACGNDTYCLFMGGWNSADFSSPNRARDTIDYVTIDTTGNATDFGNLTDGRYTSSASNGTRATAAGGWNDGARTNIIDYVTIETPGNATDFGDLSDVTNTAYGSSGAAA